MVFAGVEFLFYYLPIVMLVYFISPKKFKNLILFVSGLIFYAWGEPLYVCVLLLSTLIDYFAGIIMDKTDSTAKRRACLIVSVVMNLGLLFVFKYSSFFINTVNSVFGTSIPDPGLPLPIGISFFTFQTMSYTIDRYRNKVEVQRNFINFGAFVTCFPQIVAGPIVKYSDIAKELDSRSVGTSDLSDGISIFMCGLSKKVLLANSIGDVWAQIKACDYSTLPAATAWLGIIAFTFQIYFDFSGYSDMAIGLGRMLGFHFPKNFDYPYLSKSVSEFWRRWHMTLGSWFKDYVYFPLGGSRGTKAQTVRNLLIVWFLTGLWHGASFNFVLWGLWFGVLIVIEHLGFSKNLAKLPAAVSWLYTMLAVVLGWVLFETDSLGSAWAYLGAMFGAGGAFADSQFTAWLSECALILAICIFFAFGAGREYLAKLGGSDSKALMVVKPLVTGALLIACTAYIVNGGYNPFLYFNF